MPSGVIELGAVVVFAAMLAVTMMAPNLAARLAGEVTDESYRRMLVLRIRMICGIVLMLAAVGAILIPASAGSSPQDAGGNSLTFGHAFGGDDPRLLAMKQVPPVVGQPKSMVYLDYSYAPGAELRVGITLTNVGELPVTITGIEPPNKAGVRSLALRVPPVLGSDAPDAYPKPGSSYWASETFRPIVVPPGEDVGVVLAVTLGECKGMSPYPTLAPGASLLPATDPSLTGGFIALTSIQVDYTAASNPHTAAISLPFEMNVIWSDVSTFGCQAP